MSSLPDGSNFYHSITDGTPNIALDLFGPTVEFMTSPDEAHGDFCVLRGVVPPGAVIPLHSHDDAETFFIVAGAQQVLLPGTRGLEWSDAHAGGKFFQEVGRPVTGSLQPPTPDELARFAAIAASYGYTLGTPEENAAIGIEMPS